MHLAVAGRGGEGERVEVVHQDLPARGPGLHAALVGAQARRDHLVQLVPRRARAPVRRVPELLELGGQRARPDGVPLAAQAPDRLDPDRLGEPPPVHHRVAEGVARVEELAVLDEEHGVDEERRHRLEALVDLLGVAGGVERLLLAVEHREARARLLAVGERDAPRGQPVEAGREPRLPLDAIARALEPLDEAAEPGVAEPLVVGARPREADRRARARFHAVGQPGGRAREHEGLHRGGAHLHERGEGQHHHDQREEDVPAMQQLAHPRDPGPRRAREHALAHHAGGEGGLGGGEAARGGGAREREKALQREPGTGVWH